MRHTLHPRALVAAAVVPVAALAAWWLLSGRAASRTPPAHIAVLLDSAADDTWRDLGRCLREYAVAAASDRPGPREVRAVSPAEYAWPLPSGGEVRFRRYAYRGKVGIRQCVEAFAKDGFPIAVISPGNTVMTQALAERLQRCAATTAESRLPVLLITTATAVYLDPPTASEVARASPAAPSGSAVVRSGQPATAAESLSSTPRRKLMQLFPGRTLRFSRNNDYIAQQVTRYARSVLPQPVRQAILVRVSDDPYSLDLARAFRDEIGRAFFSQWDQTAREESLHEVQLGGLAPELDKGLTSEEADLRAQLTQWLASDEPARQDTLLVLPMLQRPAHRLLHMLRTLPAALQERVLVLAGDALPAFQPAGSRNPAAWIADLSVPLVCFQHSFNPPALAGGEAAAPLLWREIAQTAAAALDRLDRMGGPITPDAFLQEVRRSGWPRRSDGTRSMVFDDNGERAGDDYGYVLELRPAAPTTLSVLACQPTDFGPPLWDAEPLLGLPEEP